MSNSFFDNLEPINIPKLDLSYSLNIATQLQNRMDETQRLAQQAAQAAYEERHRMQEAVVQTAENTAQTNIQLQKVIENQNDYIDLLKKQLEIDAKQLDALKNIFASSEAGVTVEKEIMKLIEEQIDENHPLWDYVKDKGGDVAVAGILQWGPVIWTAVKACLVAKGIMLS